MQTQLIIALIVFLTGFSSAWKVQDVRNDAKEKQRETQLLDNEKDLRKLDNARLTNAIAAQNAATVRDSLLRGRVAAANSELDRLRSILASPGPQQAGQSTPSCPERASTVSELLGNCAGALTDLAGKADRHVNDIKKLNDSFVLDDNGR